MAAENDQADGQRRREHQSDRPPQRGPERGGNHHRDRRQSGTASVDHRLDDLADAGLDDKEQHGGPGQHRPTRIDRDRERERERRGNDRSDIGNKAQDGRQNAPEHRARNSDR